MKIIIKLQLIYLKNFLLGGGNKSFRNLCSMDEYTVKEDVEKDTQHMLSMKIIY